MIYETTNSTQAIQQGDIFFSIPWLNINPSKLSVVDEESFPKTNEMDWLAFLSEDKDVMNAIVQIKKADAIVITQNCDASRADYISLALIYPYLNLKKGEKPPQTAKNWAERIKRRSRDEQDTFYLPLDEKVGFNERMAIDFESIIQLPRKSLEELLNLRKFRLNDIAYEHFRESLAQFFRRYPYDEWYPFSKEEFEAYQAENPGAMPFEWQK